MGDTLAVLVVPWQQLDSINHPVDVLLKSCRAVPECDVLLCMSIYV